MNTFMNAFEALTIQFKINTKLKLYDPGGI
jgi:hypothetical protein